MYSNLKFIVLIFVLVILNGLFLFYTQYPRNLYPNRPQQKLKNFEREAKLFCIILTLPENLNTKAKIIYESWANLCDNSKFVLKIPKNLTHNNSLLELSKFKNDNGSIDLNNILEPSNFSQDIYDNLTNKVFQTFAFLNSNYDTYDWYLKTDDDTFIFVENLKKFLRDKHPRVGVTYGYNFAKFVKNGYHSGGAGYVLSNEALRLIGNKLNNNWTYCENTGIEDLDVAKCLRKLGVLIENSTDEFGKERFHPLSLIDHFNGNFPDWLFDYAQNYPRKVILRFLFENFYLDFSICHFFLLWSRKNCPKILQYVFENLYNL